MNAVSPDLTVSAAAVLGSVHPAESETPASGSISKTTTGASEAMKVPDNTLSEEIDEVEPIKAYSSASPVSALDDNTGKFVPVPPFCRENYETVKIVLYLHRITEVPYLLQEVYFKHKQKFRVSIESNEFGYSRGVLTVTLRTILHDSDTAIETLLVDDGVNKRLKLIDQVVLVVGRHRVAALSQLASAEKRYKWQSEGLQICSVIRKDRQPMTTSMMLIYRHSCNTLSGLVLSDSKFLDVFKTMLTFAETFVL